MLLNFVKNTHSFRVTKVDLSSAEVDFVIFQAAILIRQRVLL